MNFKERLEQLKAARKASLIDEATFQRAKQTLFTELKTGVVVSAEQEPTQHKAISPPRQAQSATELDHSVVPADEQMDMNFQERLDQLKSAYQLGLMDEKTFRQSKQTLFTELKTGIVQVETPAETPQTDFPTHSVEIPIQYTRASKRGTSLLLGLLFIGVIASGIYGWRLRNPVPVHAPPPAVETTPMADVLPDAQAYQKSPQQVQALQQQAAQRFGLPIIFQDPLKDGSRGPKLVIIPAGKFLMGAPVTEGGDVDERLHSVTIERTFAISQYPVTFQDYERFAQAQDLPIPDEQGWGRGQRPVINITWQQAHAYAEWLSGQSEQRYRLPTEAEWEYAARAGTTTPFHFGTTINTGQANYAGHFVYQGGQQGVYRRQTFPVGQFAVNAWGLADVHGNVWNWTCSVYDQEYSGAEQRCADDNEIKPMAVRGGSWSNEPKDLRSASRFSLNPDLQLNVVGFRVVREIDPLRGRFLTQR
ncbi:MAG: formylglycine-generating enzyme family protein [Candidatus Competibacteraceae bacterium]|jgi:formylglycine-generating enzyme required for sulfatase activity|nr:formylglycine-generating enzyme family protein [Candidatus Competibacteraceae bacterium]